MYFHMPLSNYPSKEPQVSPGCDLGRADMGAQCCQISSTLVLNGKARTEKNVPIPRHDHENRARLTYLTECAKNVSGAQRNCLNGK